MHENIPLELRTQKFDLGQASPNKTEAWALQKIRMNFCRVSPAILPEMTRQLNFHSVSPVS